MTIMLIDDDQGCLEALSLLLKEVGYECETFCSSLKAIEAYSIKPYEIVITDLQMPGVDGYQVLKKVLTLNPKAKVIVISGHGGGEMVNSTSNGTLAFLAKPISIVELLRIISKPMDIK